MYENQESAESAALSLANEIASKSPVAVQGSKVNLNYSRDHPVDNALEYAVSKISTQLQAKNSLFLSLSPPPSVRLCGTVPCFRVKTS